MDGGVDTDPALRIFDVYPTVAGGGSIGVTRQDGVVILHLEGALDIDAARPLRIACRRAHEAREGCVVDVRDVSFIDSAVLAALLEARQRSERSGLSFVLVLPDRRHPVARAMELARVRIAYRAGLGDAMRAAQRRPDRDGDDRPP